MEVFVLIYFLCHKLWSGPVKRVSDEGSKHIQLRDLKGHFPSALAPSVCRWGNVWSLEIKQPKNEKKIDLTDLGKRWVTQEPFDLKDTGGVSPEDVIVQTSLVNCVTALLMADALWTLSSFCLHLSCAQHPCLFNKKDTVFTESLWM